MFQTPSLINRTNFFNKCRLSLLKKLHIKCSIILHLRLLKCQNISKGKVEGNTPFCEQWPKNQPPIKSNFLYTYVTMWVWMYQCPSGCVSLTEFGQFYAHFFKQLLLKTSNFLGRVYAENKSAASVNHGKSLSLRSLLSKIIFSRILRIGNQCTNSWPYRKAGRQQGQLPPPRHPSPGEKVTFYHIDLWNLWLLKTERLFRCNLEGTESAFSGNMGSNFYMYAFLDTLNANWGGGALHA